MNLRNDFTSFHVTMERSRWSQLLFLEEKVPGSRRDKNFPKFADRTVKRVELQHVSPAFRGPRIACRIACSRINSAHFFFFF